MAKNVIVQIKCLSSDRTPQNAPVEIECSESTNQINQNLPVQTESPKTSHYESNGPKCASTSQNATVQIEYPSTKGVL